MIISCCKANLLLTNSANLLSVKRKVFNTYDTDHCASFAIVFLMVLGSSGSYVAGNSPANSPATPASKVAVVDTNGTFIFGSVQGPLTDLNPVTATSTAGDISALLYSSLLYPGASGGVVPWLAKSYNISDQGKLFTFNMVTNATWSNGNPVTS